MISWKKSLSTFFRGLSWSVLLNVHITNITTVSTPIIIICHTNRHVWTCMHRVRCFLDFKHLLHKKHRHVVSWPRLIRFSFVFIRTVHHVFRLLPGELISERYSISYHVFSNISLVAVLRASVVPGFKVSVSRAGELNTLSLVYSEKQKKGHFG